MVTLGTGIGKSTALAHPLTSEQRNSLLLLTVGGAGCISGTISLRP